MSNITTSNASWITTNTISTPATLNTSWATATTPVAVTTDSTYATSTPRNCPTQKHQYISQMTLWNQDHYLFIPYNESSYYIKHFCKIIDVKEHRKNHVYEFTFEDGTHIKTICDPNDTFDFSYACALAIAKKMYKNKLTFEGILKKTDEILYSLAYVKIIKDTKKILIEKQKQEEKEKEQKAIEKRRKIKRVEKKKARARRLEDKQIDIISKAIKKSQHNDDY